MSRPLPIENLFPDISGEVVQERGMLDDSSLHVRAMNASSMHFLIVDMLAPGRPILFANRALAARHGTTPEKLVGMELSEFRGGAPNSDLIDAAMNEGRSLRTDIHFPRPDGSPFSMEISLNPIHDATGRVTHYVSVGNEITEQTQKQRELQSKLETQVQQRESLELELRLAQKLEAIGRLAAGVAHEINTPIQFVGDSVQFLRSAVSDMTQLLSSYRVAIKRIVDGMEIKPIADELAAAESAADSEFIEEEMPRAFGRTTDGVERVAALVRAMKEFSHPQSNEHSPADINHALNATLTVAANEYRYCASVTTAFSPLPPVMCNINELNQVFLNLVVNAAHAIQEAAKDASCGKIDVSTIQQGDWVRVVFADNGCGIPRENQEKIFDPFFTTKEVGKGTGQGLALTRAIVIDKHGGEIEVKSKVGVGSRFVLWLPIHGRRPPTQSDDAASS